MNTPAIKSIEPTPAANEASGRRRQRDLWALTSDTVIERFLDSYWIRYGVSPQTLHAYRDDLTALDRWMVLFKRKTLVGATANDIRDFLHVKYSISGGFIQGDPPSLSCVKRFYFYLLECRFRDDDPTEKVFVRTPRLARRDLWLVNTTSAESSGPARA